MADLITMLSAAAGAGGEYEISRSLRFNSADSAYLNRTFSTGNRKTWTWSAWVKRSALGAVNRIFAADDGTPSSDTDYNSFLFNSSDQLVFAGNNTTFRTTNAVFRDPSAFYHIVLTVDTTEASGANRIKIWVNNVAQTFSSPQDPNQSVDLAVNSNIAHYIGAVTGSSYTNIYLADVHFIDGQALTPSSFGETDTDTGVWKPIAYAGTYGTNGFHLDFSDNSSTTALGYDAAGSNDWTPNNFSVTAGAGNDSLVDTPTPYGTDTGAGGEVRGNYATLNPLKNTATILDGNLRATNPGSLGYYTAFTTMEMTSGKYYFELTVSDDGVNARLSGFGISDSSVALPTIGTSVTTNTTASNSRGWVQLFRSAVSTTTTGLYNNGASVNTTTRATTSGTRIFMVAYDADTGKCWMGYEGTWWTGDPSAGTSEYFTATAPMTPVLNTFNDGSTSTFAPNINFGQRPFAYTAPSGFKALCTTNLPDPTVVQGDDYFNIALYTGNNSTNAITGLGFSPDLVWIKSRSNAENNLLFDTNRGRGYGLYSNLTNAEAGPSPSDKDLVSFDSDGFTLGQIYNFNVNDSGKTFVGWAWRGSDSSAVSNTDGTITSTVSANTTAGISIVTYTGTGSAATVGHGLGAAPRMIIVKNRDAADAWQVYHAANTANPETDYLVLNTTAATADAADRWNDTLPTSTVFSIGNGVEVNTNTEKYVAYCFAEVEGFSKFGSYTGNGNADGPFVYTGFRPAFVMIKRTDSTSNWTILDLKREGYNVDNDPLFPNLSDAETTTDLADLLSNGFKLRSTDASVNASGGNYVFAAFSSNPFKFALAR